MHPILQGQTQTVRHHSAWLSCGEVSGPLMILVHGWPERAISWRHQLQYFAQLGFYVVAPDMRGYGDSTRYFKHEDYTVEEAVEDMLELLASLGRKEAIWLGHDWGSPVVWALASHHPERCVGIANLCVPYLPQGFTIDALVPLIDRQRYPADRYPAGQWEYFLYYRENFARAQACLEANIPATVKAMFRRGSPLAENLPARTALTRIEGGWFGGAACAPEVPMDTTVIDEEAFNVYVTGLTKNGFFGPGSWYVNDAANAEYAARSVSNGRLHLPVLFVHARFDHVCETLNSRLAEPMRAYCSALTETTVDSGHWMAQEQPQAVNARVTEWLKSNQFF
jgi:pimeloyl-ACP methyl ester carboxylesterase